MTYSKTEKQCMEGPKFWYCKRSRNLIHTTCQWSLFLYASVLLKYFDCVAYNLYATKIFFLTKNFFHLLKKRQLSYNTPTSSTGSFLCLQCGCRGEAPLYLWIKLNYFNFLSLSEGEGSGGSEESESEEEVVEEGVTVKRKKKHRRKSKSETGLVWEENIFGFSHNV